MISSLHLLYLVPIIFYCGAMFGIRREKQKNMYAKFDADMKKGYDVEGNNVVSFDPGNPTGSYVESPNQAAQRRSIETYFAFGDPGHGRTSNADGPIPNDIGDGPHPGRKCDSSCWRKPGGHRWNEHGADMGPDYVPANHKRDKVTDEELNAARDRWKAQVENDMYRTWPQHPGKKCNMTCFGPNGHRSS